jgi:H-type lectin domain
MDGTHYFTEHFSQQTTSPLVGMQIITAYGELFNHVDKSLPMWSGNGDRRVQVEVQFAAPFERPPHIILGLTGVDSSKAQNLRFNLTAQKVTMDGFVIEFHTWGDTKIARASANWTAIGAGIPLHNYTGKK